MAFLNESGNGCLAVTVSTDNENNEASRLYNLYLPGMEESCNPPGDTRNENHCRCLANYQLEEDDGEDESDEISYYELYRLQEDINLYKKLLDGIKRLIKLGVQTLDEARPVLVRQKLLEYASQVMPDSDPEQFLQTIGKKSSLSLLEVVQDIPMILNKLNIYMFRTRTPLQEVEVYLEENWKSRCEVISVKTTQLKERYKCCFLFRKFPAPVSPLNVATNLPLPLPFEILQKLSEYSSGKLLKERWAKELHKRPRLSCATTVTLRGRFPKMLHFRLDQLIHQYPHGIEIELFWIKFKSIYSYLPTLEDLGLQNLDELIKVSDSIFYIAENAVAAFEQDGSPSFPLLIFPVCKNRPSPISILKKCYHRIKCLFINLKLSVLNVHDKRVEEVLQPYLKNWNLEVLQFLKHVIHVMRELDDFVTLDIDELCSSNPSKEPEANLCSKFETSLCIRGHDTASNNPSDTTWNDYFYEKYMTNSLE